MTLRTAFTVLVALVNFAISVGSEHAPLHGVQFLASCWPTDCDLSCDDGPYIVNPVYLTQLEGVGSTLQHCRTGLLLETLTSWKWIPTLYGIAHNSSIVGPGGWALHYLGFCDLYQRCNYCSLLRKIEQNEIAIMEDIPSFQLSEDIATGRVCPRFTPNSVHDAAILNTTEGKLMLKMQESSEKGRTNEVVVIREFTMLENPGCTIPLMEEKYAATLQFLKRERKEKKRQRSQVGVGRDLRMVVHVRLGDLAEDENDARAVPRRMASMVLRMAQTCFLNDWFHRNVSYTILSEAGPDHPYMAHILKELPFVRAVQGSPRTTLRDLDMMAAADVLVIGTSSFSVLGATINEQEGIFITDNNNYKLTNWHLWKGARIITWNQDFPETFCEEVARRWA